MTPEEIEKDLYLRIESITGDIPKKVSVKVTEKTILIQILGRSKNVIWSSDHFDLKDDYLVMDTMHHIIKMVFADYLTRGSEDE